MAKRTSAAADEVPEQREPARQVEFEWVPYGKITPWALNPNEGDVEGIMESLKAYGWGRPLVVNLHPTAAGELVIGHHTLQAAQRLEAAGISIPFNGRPGYAPVSYVNLPKKKAHGLSLADNRRHEKAKLNEDKLGKVVGLDEIDPEDWMAAGFTEREVKSLMFTPWPTLEETNAPSLNYSVIIECTDETQQTELLERFELEGLRCKPWVG